MLDIASSGSWGVVDKRLAEGSKLDGEHLDVNAKEFDGESLLHKAARQGDLEAVKGLLSSHAAVDITNEATNQSFPYHSLASSNFTLASPTLTQ